MSSKIRFRFERGEQVKFISHLDLMRTFDRALRRAQLPIAYSQGFNPHPQMIFALPLTVGVTGDHEYADFEFSEPVSPEEFKQRLGEQLPQGITIKEAVYNYSKENVMTIIKLAAFVVEIETPQEEDIAHTIRNFLSQETIIVPKRTKQGMKNVDIRPLIQELDVCDKENFSLRMLLSAGNTVNLKPELLLEALSDFAKVNIKILKIHRTALFACANGKKHEPMDDIFINNAD